MTLPTAAKPVERIEPAGILQSSNRLVLWGLHGVGAEYILGIQVHDVFIERRSTISPLTGEPPETVDQLRERVMRDVVPVLPPEALRDSKGSAVGYFVYEGLPEDHCRATAYAQGVR